MSSEEQTELQGEQEVDEETTESEDDGSVVTIAGDDGAEEEPEKESIEQSEQADSGDDEGVQDTSIDEEQTDQSTTDDPNETQQAHSAMSEATDPEQTSDADEEEQTNTTTNEEEGVEDDEETERATDETDNEDGSVLGQINSLVEESVEVGLEGEEYIAFRSSNLLAPNMHVSQRRFKGNSAMVFLFDPNDDILYLKPVTDEEANKIENERSDIKITRYSFSNDGKVNPISVRELISQWNLTEYIQQDVTERFYPSWDDEVQAVAIDLSEDPETIEVRTDSKEPEE